MIGLPQVTVIGTLVSDPELRYTPSGSAVCNLTIASNARKLNKQTGQYEDGDATFLRANLWREAAEQTAESLTRGCRVVAVGQLKQRNFEDRDGNKRTVMELEVEEIGPSTRWATVKVTKVSRDGASGGGGREQSNAPADDPWGSQSAAASGQGSYQDEEAPF